MKAIILAGGTGTRLWPLSRRDYPKQFLKINSGPSLLQETSRRLLQVVAPGDIVVMTNSEYQFHVTADLGADLKEGGVRNLVLEPCRRNTAPALALAATFCRDRLGCEADEVLFVAPADHVIRPAERFAEYMRRAQEVAASGRIVTFGIRPTEPETGYGYIKAGEALGPGFLRVERFVEKPDLQAAQRYLEGGDYFWNSGMFAFQIGTLLEELRRYAPDIHAIADGGFDQALAAFASMPDISIDHAVLESSERVVTMPMDLHWSDVGSWDSLFAALGGDEKGNLQLGDVVAVDTSGTMILSDKRLVAAIGLSDLIVVETDDAILIARRGEARRVKEIVSRLDEQERSEAAEHLTTYRPWGHYTVLGSGEGYQIKRIVVNPGEKLSLQMHHHRNEHWVVVRGTALVTVGDSEKLLHANDSTYVPKSTRHRLANAGEAPLELIEVQSGDYVGEDDIVRFDDVYGRHEAGK
jgi:mannose-1-phosphate guanylyltransferase/mannose-6-phosphate isomerase